MFGVRFGLYVMSKRDADTYVRRATHRSLCFDYIIVLYIETFRGKEERLH